MNSSEADLREFFATAASHDRRLLRDYFAASAPDAPAEWFTSWFQANYPVRKPKLPEGAAYCDGCKGDSDCEQTEACLSAKRFQIDCDEWRRQKQQDMEIQWRWQWADLMLQARAKGQVVTGTKAQA